MKRTVSLILAMLLFVACAAPAFAEDAREDISQQVNTNVSPLYVVDRCALVVDGKEVKGYEDDVKIYYNDDGFSSAQIPLITTIKALGGTVLWISPTKAMIFVRSMILYFDLEKALLFTPFLPYYSNLLVNPFAGGSGVFEQYSLDQEYICNEHSWMMLKFLLRVQIKEDVKSSTISVEKITINEIIRLLTKEIKAL